MEKPQQQGSTEPSTDDYIFAINESETIFSIEDVELEEYESTTLGDTQDAREDHGVADLKIGKTSLDLVFTNIVYGSYNGHPACRALLDFTIKSHTAFRVQSAEVNSTVKSETTENIHVASNDIVRPSVLKTIPKNLNDEHPTEVGVNASRVFSPNVTTPSGVGGSIGSFIKQKSYTETWGWHLHSSVSSSHGHKTTSRDTGEWSFTANRMQKDSELHLFGIEVLFRHAGEPFYADFQLEATLTIGASLRTIGKRKKIRTRRRFFPCDSSFVFST